MLDEQYGDDPAFVVSMLIGLSSRYMDVGNTRKAHAVLRLATGTPPPEDSRKRARRWPPLRSRS